MSILRSLRGMAAAVAVAACVLGTTTTASVAADPTDVTVVRTSTGSGVKKSDFFELVGTYTNAVLNLTFSSYTPTSTNTSGLITIELFTKIGHNLVASFISPTYTSATGATSITSSPFSIGPGEYTLWLTSKTNGGTFSKDVTATATFGAATPVPGPIAAAGLPGLLALAGYGLYRRRNRAA